LSIALTEERHAILAFNDFASRCLFFAKSDCNFTTIINFHLCVTSINFFVIETAVGYATIITNCNYNSKFWLREEKVNGQ